MQRITHMYMLTSINILAKTLTYMYLLVYLQCRFLRRNQQNNRRRRNHSVCHSNTENNGGYIFVHMPHHVGRQHIQCSHQGCHKLHTARSTSQNTKRRGTHFCNRLGNARYLCHMCLLCSLYCIHWYMNLPSDQVYTWYTCYRLCMCYSLLDTLNIRMRLWSPEQAVDNNHFDNQLCSWFQLHNHRYCILDSRSYTLGPRNQAYTMYISQGMYS